MDVNVDVVRLAAENASFRRELLTGPKAQVVLMSIPPGGEIGEEVHDGVDQVLVFVEGEGEAILDGEPSPVSPGRLVLVPAAMRLMGNANWWLPRSLDHALPRVSFGHEGGLRPAAAIED